jgi:hypothetical protein
MAWLKHLKENRALPKASSLALMAAALLAALALEASLCHSWARRLAAAYHLHGGGIAAGWKNMALYRYPAERRQRREG